jgi:hypothetical protein
VRCVRATKNDTTGTALDNVSSSASPLNLLTWRAPGSNDPVSIEFKQSIGTNDPLRMGSYSKTLTFTLSTIEQLVGHRERRLLRSRAIGDAGAQLDGRAAGLDRVAGA